MKMVILDVFSNVDVNRLDEEIALHSIDMEKLFLRYVFLNVD